MEQFQKPNTSNFLFIDNQNGSQTGNPDFGKYRSSGLRSKDEKDEKSQKNPAAEADFWNAV